MTFAYIYKGSILVATKIIAIMVLLLLLFPHLSSDVAFWLSVFAVCAWSIYHDYH